MTIARSSTRLSYTENIGRAARALLIALLAVTPDRRAASVTAATKAASAARRKSRRDDLSLYRLYQMAGSYDSVMPNLAQELRVIASRD